jgi:CRISPR-associated protein Csd1
MLLQRLVEFRPTSDPDAVEPDRPYSRFRAARWELDLDLNGGSAALIDLTNPSDPAAKFGLLKLVPNAGRTSGIAPVLGVDDVQYVLGWADDKTKPDRVDSAHNAFVELVRRWASHGPPDAGAAALLRFYERGGPQQLSKPERWTSKDLVVVKVDGRYVMESESLWSLWKTVVETRKSGTASGEAGRSGLCLVCGRVGTLLNRMPQALPKALVPRAEQEIALVSANKRIHTYDFSEGLAAAPICLNCGQSAVANLHTVLSDRAHTFTYSRQRTRMAWWVTKGGDTRSVAMLDENPDVISDFLHSVATALPIS